VAYLVYARRFRPQRFDEIVGQKSVVGTLANALRTDRVGHAYLFCGPRGTGKTTTARILAKALNCEQRSTPEPCCACDQCRRTSSGESLDLVEIDAASHRKIEDIRELREGVWSSTLGSRFRVYIIDEVHMLTTEAFNAFLKVLEEPPPHVKFVLCTTDPQKMPETVRSRCQRLDFRRLAASDVVARLRQIAEKETLEVSDDALREIARHAEGGLRDAEVLLEQLSVYTEDAITVDDVRALTGTVDAAKLGRVAQALGRGRAGEALEVVDGIFESGTDAGELLDALVSHLRDALALDACGEDSPLVRARGIDLDAVRGTASSLSQEELLYAAAVLQAARKEAKVSPQPRTVMELALLRLSKIKELVSLEELASRLRGAALPVAGEETGRGHDVPERAPRPKQSPPADREAARVRAPEAAPREQAPPPAEPEAPPPPPPPLPPPLPPPPAGELTLEEVAKRWALIQAAVGKRSVIAGALLKNGEPSRVDGDRVYLGFSAQWAFHRQRLSEPESLTLIAQAASEVLGRPVAVVLEAAAKAGGERPSAPARPGAAEGESPRAPAAATADRESDGPAERGERGERPESAAIKDPRIRKLLERTDGRIVRIDRTEK